MGDGITPPDRGARRRVIWFVDNTVSLHSFIKGRASHAALDRAISMAKFLQARTRLGTVSGQGARARAGSAQGHARVSIWMEFVDSEGNWADGISRDLGEDAFARAHGFHTASMQARPPTHAAPPGYRVSARGGRLTRACGPPRRSKLGAWHGRWPSRQLTRPPPARHQWHRTLAAHETAATAFLHCQTVPAGRISVGERGVGPGSSVGGLGHALLPLGMRWGRGPGGTSAWACDRASGGVGGTPSPIATPLSPTPVGPRFLIASDSGWVG